MNITCDMAMDLIALYNDGLASDDSRRAVDEHLKNCPECSAAYASYSAPAPHAVSGQPKKSAEDLEIKYMSLARALRKNQLISTATTLGIVIASLAIGSYGMLHLIERRHPGSEF